MNQQKCSCSNLSHNTLKIDLKVDFQFRLTGKFPGWVLIGVLLRGSKGYKLAPECFTDLFRFLCIIFIVLAYSQGELWRIEELTVVTLRLKELLTSDGYLLWMTGTAMMIGYRIQYSNLYRSRGNRRWIDQIFGQCTIWHSIQNCWLVDQAIQRRDRNWEKETGQGLLFPSTYTSW